jgi:hypothetical protein
MVKMRRKFIEIKGNRVFAMPRNSLLAQPGANTHLKICFGRYEIKLKVEPKLQLRFTID